MIATEPIPAQLHRTRRPLWFSKRRLARSSSFGRREDGGRSTCASCGRAVSFCTSSAGATSKCVTSRRCWEPHGQSWQPVMTMIVFAVFFGRVAGLASQSDVPYPIFVYAALLPWQVFATSVTQSASSLVASAHLISKVYFPRLIVPLATIGVSLVDFAISLLVMFGLMAWNRIPLSLSAAALPVCLVGTLVVSVGLGIGLAALTVAYRDFRHAVPFLVQIWMFASPVAYSFEKIPESFRLLYALNPMAGLISAYRSSPAEPALPLGCDRRVIDDLAGTFPRWHLLLPPGRATICRHRLIP